MSAIVGPDGRRVVKPKLSLTHKRTRELVAELFVLGFTTPEVSKQTGIKQNTIRVYRQRHPEFNERCNAGATPLVARIRATTIEAIHTHVQDAAKGKVKLNPAVAKLILSTQEPVQGVDRRDVGEETVKAMNAQIAKSLAIIREQGGE